jgi:hypothetical protein
MAPLLIKKSKDKIFFFLFPLHRRGVEKDFAKRYLLSFLLFLLLPLFSFAQWNPSNPLIPAPADCPIAYRICDANQTYNFELVDDGAIDDANGSLGIPGLNRSSPSQFESRSAFIIFNPQYTGQFGFDICPESIEDLAFILFENPNCGDLQTGAYTLITQANVISSPTDACTGIGVNPHTGLGQSDYNPYITITAGNTYILFVSLETINQPGTHKFTLSFTGSVVSANPDLFTIPSCIMSTEDFAVQEVKVYPNPFNNTLYIESTTAFKAMALYDVLGKEIINQDFVNQLDTSKLAQGMYLLRLITEDGVVVVKKVVKE